MPDHEPENRGRMTPPDGENEYFVSVINELWAEFCAGVGNFKLCDATFFDTGVWIMLEPTAKPDWEEKFKPGSRTRTETDRCCRQSGIIARAIATVQGNTEILEGDFKLAVELVGSLTKKKRVGAKGPRSSFGGVC